jgi:hypothetical protein
MERQAARARPEVARGAISRKATWRRLPLALIATGTLAVCGVKAPPRPPQQDAPAAPASSDAGAAAAPGPSAAPPASPPPAAAPSPETPPGGPPR